MSLGFVCDPRLLFHTSALSIVNTVLLHLFIDDDRDIHPKFFFLTNDQLFSLAICLLRIHFRTSNLDLRSKAYIRLTSLQCLPQKGSEIRNDKGYADESRMAESGKN